jgi:ligand-binding sensor domain-containing protein/signal transduction histidine kinase
MMRFLALPLPGFFQRAARCAALLAALTAALQAWSAEPEWLVRTWRLEDGLPDVKITAIQQTPDGYLWVGTPKGLARFDGAQFKIFDSQRVPALADDRISALLTDRRGVLWIACESGRLLCYEAGRFQLLNRDAVADLMPATGFVGTGKGQSSPTTRWMWGRTIGLVEDETGAVWAATDKGLLRCQGTRLTRYTSTNGLPAAELGGMCADSAGQLWLAAGNALACWRGGQWVGPENIRLAAGPLARLATARRGGIWTAEPRGSWAEGGGLVRRLDAGQWREQLDPTPWTPNSLRSQVTTLLEDHAGRVWIGLLWNGIFFAEPGRPWRRLQSDGPLSQCIISCLYEDRHGALWVGTVGESLHCISQRPVTMLKLPAPAQENIVNASCATRDGSIWFGTDGAGAFRSRNGRFESFGREQGLSDPHVCSIFEDSQTNFWFGGWGGLFQFEQGRFTRVEGPPELRMPVLTLFEDHAGRLWAGTPHGLVCRRKGEWSVRPLVEADAYLDIRSLAEDAAGNLWVGTIGEGLFRVRESQVTQFRNSKGFTSQNARALYCDPAGVLWIGTYGEGLFRFQDGQFTACTTADGLPCDNLLSLFPDDAGNLWMSSDNGIFACSRAVLQAYQPGSSPALLCVRLTLAEGLGSLPCSGGGQPVASRTADGRFCFPDMRGLAVFDPRVVAVQQPPPSVLVESVIADGTELAPAPGGELRTRSSVRRFEFHYTVPDLAAPQALRFRYKLEGMDPDWVDAKNQRTVFYSQLPPGEYQFRVMAGGADGQWHEAPAPLSLHVVPRIWELRWVQALAGMLFVGSVAASILVTERRRLRRRHQRLIAQLEQDHALEAERARIARDIHDDLGARATKISMLAEMARDESAGPDEPQGRWQDILTTSQEMIQAMDETVWAVSPSKDTLASLAEYILHYAEEFLRHTDLRRHLRMPESLPNIPLTAERRHNVFMAVKEALHNVLKHAAASEVRIELSLADGVFRVLIADNGRGFTPAQDRGGGDGLANMRQRLEQLGGVCQVQSSPGQGTTVTLELRLGLPHATA